MTQTAAEVVRDYETDGVPASGFHQGFQDRAQVDCWRVASLSSGSWSIALR
ncbi:hypothetical protein [Bradyrhizobium sp. 18]|uniref:hypothetical protein n=1 Tax=Bradyrhizobium sp. 18 TaxID=2782657 RepID=UPI001FFA897C|nr:hypothetical protein [Bradyrhizobium sp. 18]MCK1503853.1 hypothetical protein [Bradyrhizobium sp. 18]